MTRVRREGAGDAAAVHAVLVACFPTDAEARLVGLLRDAGSLSISLVAEKDGEIVGHVAFSPVSVEREDEGAGLGAAVCAEAVGGAGLGPLAVLEARRGRGIGAALVRAGLSACRDAGLGWVVVHGDPGYYSCFGFRTASAAGLVDEYGGGPAFQVLELNPGALPAGAGLVYYAPEFSSLD